MRPSCHRLFEDVEYGCTSHTYINVCLPNYCRLCPLYEPAEYGGYPWSRVGEILQLLRFDELNVQDDQFIFSFQKKKNYIFFFTLSMFLFTTAIFGWFAGSVVEKISLAFS